MAEHTKAAEQGTEMGRHHVLQEDEANPVGRPRQKYHPVENRRYLHHRKELLELIGVFSLHQQRDVEALVVDVGKWMARIYSERS